MHSVKIFVLEDWRNLINWHLCIRVHVMMTIYIVCIGMCMCVNVEVKKSMCVGR